MGELILEAREYGKTIAIIGFRNVRVDDVELMIKLVREVADGASIQVFNADHVAGWRHLFLAALNALKAFNQKLNVSRNLAVETLLYAAGVRQISKAIKMLGVKPESKNLAMLIIADSREKAEEIVKSVEMVVGGLVDDSVLDLRGEGKLNKLIQTFKISKSEIEAKAVNSTNKAEAVAELIFERCSLLAIKV